MKTGLLRKAPFLAAFLAGAAMVLSFAPWDFSALTYRALFIFLLALTAEAQPSPLILHYVFALGLFGVGISWIFISINTYGGASILLAGALTGLFVLLWSLTFLPQALILKFLSGGTLLRGLPWFSIVWVLGEWFRGWFLTGFPWLYVGYAQGEGLIGGWAPFGGALLVSFVAVLLVELSVRCWRNKEIKWLGVIVGILLASSLVSEQDFVREKGTLRIAGIQANLDQHTKWLPQQFESNLEAHTRLMGDLENADLIVWSEASLTRFADQAGRELEALDQWAASRKQGLIIGVPSRDDAGYYNGVRGLGVAEGSYLKRHLVPFGEFVPLAPLLRGAIDFFDLPMSRNQPGPMDQVPITFLEHALSVSICYEVVNAELVRLSAVDPALMLTVSNDTWFGRSMGPEQHLEIAQMRAREMGRSMFRVTNNGVTALISNRGEVLARLPSDGPGVLMETVKLYEGKTPFAGWGHWPLITACLLLLGLGLAERLQIRSWVSRWRGP